MQTELVALQREYDNAVYAMFQSIPADENGLVNSANGLNKAEYMAWLEKSCDDALKTGIYDGFKVPQSTFVFYADGEPVGLIRIRHFLTDKLLENGGHIGCAICPQKRGLGLSKLMLKAALGRCKGLGINNALATIHENNLPSIKMALACGGRIDRRQNGLVYVWFDIAAGAARKFYDTADLTDGQIMLRVRRMNDALPEKQFVPAYYFDICLPDGQRVGECDLRIGHSAKLYIGGNIGYSVDAPFRGHGYAAKACILLCKLAQRHGLGHLFISCAQDNIASYKTMLAAGFRFIGMARVKEGDDMYAEGIRRVIICRKEIGR